MSKTKSSKEFQRRGISPQTILVPNFLKFKYFFVYRQRTGQWYILHKWTSRQPSLLSHYVTGKWHLRVNPGDYYIKLSLSNKTWNSFNQREYILLSVCLTSNNSQLYKAICVSTLVLCTVNQFRVPSDPCLEQLRVVYIDRVRLKTPIKNFN